MMIALSWLIGIPTPPPIISEITIFRHPSCLWQGFDPPLTSLLQEKKPSCEEEALFWESRDREDFADEWKGIEAKVARPLRITYTIRLEPETIERLREIGNKKGVGPTALAGMWMLEEAEGSGKHWVNAKDLG